MLPRAATSLEFFFLNSAWTLIVDSCILKKEKQEISGTSFVWILVGVPWVMLRIVVRMLNSWRGSFHSHRNSNV